jgi:hypothetical protein
MRGTAAVEGGADGVTPAPFDLTTRTPATPEASTAAAAAAIGHRRRFGAGGSAAAGRGSAVAVARFTLSTSAPTSDAHRASLNSIAWRRISGFSGSGS